jgi:hypothetical protein
MTIFTASESAKDFTRVSSVVAQGVVIPRTEIHSNVRMSNVLVSLYLL